MTRHRGIAGFTLIELLVATGIIGILMTVVLVAVNPFRMFAAAQQTKRSSDVSTIGKSLDMYLISAKGVFPTQMYPLNTPKRIAKNSGGPEADLCALLSTQIPGLPIDPTTPGTVVKDCTGSYNTGYNAVANASGKIGVYSPTGISLANATGMNVITYGYVPDDFITPPSPVTAYKGQWGLDETTSTDTNQFKASGYLDTGKLGQAVSVYGNAAGTAGSTLTFNRGAQIGGNNYEHFNSNQGTVSFWFKPSWNGNDGAAHSLFINYPDATHFIYIFKQTTNNLIQAYYLDGTHTGIVTTSSTTLTAGTFYHVVFRWSVNTIDGTNYADIRVNNGTPTASATAYTGYTPSPASFVGSSDPAHPLNALIDDFAIFDRVLSTTEITSLYNSGNGNEAGYVADSSLKFYAKMDGSGTLQPVTYNGGASASKMTAKSTELTGGTNLVADGNMELAGTTNWVSQSGFDLVTKNADNLIFDSQNLKMVRPSSGASAVVQNFTVLPNTTYRVSLWAKRSAASGWGRVMVYDVNNSTILSDYNITSSTWVEYETIFKTASNTTTARLYYYDGPTTGDTIYVDNVSIVPNLVDNGGMEGQYVIESNGDPAPYSATV
ncbi:MAG: LamG-like jellyroll fold domain-containing protein, partial [Candidatus Roizmanbacteria bacterium]